MLDGVPPDDCCGEALPSSACPEMPGCPNGPVQDSGEVRFAGLSSPTMWSLEKLGSLGEGERGKGLLGPSLDSSLPLASLESWGCTCLCPSAKALPHTQSCRETLHPSLYLYPSQSKSQPCIAYRTCECGDRVPGRRRLQKLRSIFCWALEDFPRENKKEPVTEIKHLDSAGDAD